MPSFEFSILVAATGASTKERMRRLGHASPRAALLYQHATEKRDEAIADGIDQIMQTGRAEATSRVIPFPGATCKR